MVNPEDEWRLAPALADALQRLGQAIGVILTAQIGTSAHAGAELRCRDRIRAVIRFETDDAPTADGGDQQTASTAVVGGAPDADPFFRN